MAWLIIECDDKDDCGGGFVFAKLFSSYKVLCKFELMK